MREYQKVPGKNKGKVILYALSTCVWCTKTKNLLNDLEIEYEYVYMDQLDQDVEDRFNQHHEKWNPKCSYPTLIINDEKCIVGYNEEEIRGLLA